MLIRRCQPHIYANYVIFRHRCRLVRRHQAFEGAEFDRIHMDDVFVFGVGRTLDVGDEFGTSGRRVAGEDELRTL